MTDPDTHPPTQTPPGPHDLIRIERGQATPEELAALTVLLLARAARCGILPPAAPATPIARWQRPEREPGHRTPRSWRGRTPPRSPSPPQAP